MVSRILLPPTSQLCSIEIAGPKSGGIMKAAYSLVGILMLSLLSGMAFAQPIGDFQLPEPGVLELLGLAGVVAVVVRLRNRRK
jgi:hypothetical protein